MFVFTAICVMCESIFLSKCNVMLLEVNVPGQLSDIYSRGQRVISAKSNMYIIYVLG